MVLTFATKSSIDGPLGTMCVAERSDHANASEYSHRKTKSLNMKFDACKSSSLCSLSSNVILVYLLFVSEVQQLGFVIKF